MNFLEAVRELKEGRCEGIKRTGCFGYMALNEQGWLCLKGIDGDLKLMPEAILDESWQLVNPKLQFEEVEETCYCLIDRLGRKHFYEHVPQPIEGTETFKMTGIRKVEIKPKVKHREEVTNINSTMLITGLMPPFSYKDNKVRVFVEWEE